MDTKPVIPPIYEREPRPDTALIRQLRELGHFNRENPNLAPSVKQIKSWTIKSSPVKDAIASYQDWHGLRVDGDLGPYTAAHMSRPRCGLADIVPARNCTPKWGFLDVTYAHRLIFNAMAAEDIQNAVVIAANQWNAVCGLWLRFQQEITTANIWMEAKPIDQAGGTLAWSYMPGCNAGPQTRIQQRYDTREQWASQFLIAVVCHELGHAMGFDHTNSPGNLMNPFYDPSITMPQQSWDIPSAVALYGQVAPPIPPDPPAPPVPPVPGVGNISSAIRIADNLGIARTYIASATLIER